MLGFIALRPAPADLHWYVIADDGLVVFDSAEGIGSAKRPTASRNPAAAFPRLSILDPSLAGVLDEARAMAAVVFNGTPERDRVAVARAGRWAVVAVEGSR